jgi:serine/threonine protein kinase
MRPIKYGQYELIDRIARGGMAEVFKARMRGAAGFEKVVAVKRLHAHLSEDDDMVAMLKDEARLVSNMVHPNICQVLDLGMVQDTYFIAMEYIYGKDISTIARFERDNNRRIPLDIALYIIRHSLTGLDYAHRMVDPVTGTPLNIIHRDISPQNILVAYNGGIKIIDFGIAKAAESLHHTQSGVIKGKFRYMAKEQASGWDIDHRIDIFASGMVIYEMLLGEPYSLGYSDAQLIIQAQTGVVEPIGKLIKDLPLGLDLAIMKALSPNRESRFPSARTFRNALDIIVKREGLEVAPEAVASYLSSLFPDPYSKGSRVDEVEQLSARDLVMLSPVPDVMDNSGSGEYSRGESFSDPGPSVLPVGYGSAPSNDYSNEMLPPPYENGDQLNYYSENAGPEGFADNSQLPPNPNQDQYDYYQGEKQFDTAGEFAQADADPVGLTKATSESGRERRKRERVERKDQLLAKEEARASTPKRDLSALPKAPRKPVIGPFLSRLGKALVSTFINIFLFFAVLGIGAGVYKYTNTRDKHQKIEDDIKNKPALKRKKRCARGKVYLTVKSTPKGGDLFLEGKPTNMTTPVFNLEYKMCFNQPLLVRVEKGNLSSEQSVDFPLKGNQLSLNLKLSKDGSFKHVNVNIKKSSRNSASNYSRKSTSASSKKSNNKTMGSGDNIPSVKTKDSADIAGGIGVLKVSCSKPCNVFVNGRKKGVKRVFTLRARKKPYIVKVLFKDGSFSPEKAVYIFPSQNNFAHFVK